METSTPIQDAFNKNEQFSPKALDRLQRQRAFAQKQAITFSRLSVREREILALIAEGGTNQSIGHKLFVSVHTVRTHRNNIWRRLGIRSVVEAVWWGQCFDLV